MNPLNNDGTNSGKAKLNSLEIPEDKTEKSGFWGRFVKNHPKITATGLSVGKKIFLQNGELQKNLLLNSQKIDTLTGDVQLSSTVRLLIQKILPNVISWLEQKEEDGNKALPKEYTDLMKDSETSIQDLLEVNVLQIFSKILEDYCKKKFPFNEPNQPLIPSGKEIATLFDAIFDVLSPHVVKIEEARKNGQDIKPLFQELAKDIIEKGLGKEKKLILPLRVVGWFVNVNNKLVNALEEGLANELEQEWPRLFPNFDPNKTEDLKTKLNQITKSPLASDVCKSLTDYIFKEVPEVIKKNSFLLGDLIQENLIDQTSQADLAASWEAWIIQEISDLATPPKEGPRKKILETFHERVLQMFLGGFLKNVENHQDKKMPLVAVFDEITGVLHTFLSQKLTDDQKKQIYLIHEKNKEIRPFKAKLEKLLKEKAENQKSGKRSSEELTVMIEDLKQTVEEKGKRLNALYTNELNTIFSETRKFLFEKFQIQKEDLMLPAILEPVIWSFIEDKVTHILIDLYGDLSYPSKDLEERKKEYCKSFSESLIGDESSKALENVTNSLTVIIYDSFTGKNKDYSGLSVKDRKIKEKEVEEDAKKFCKLIAESFATILPDSRYSDEKLAGFIYNWIATEKEYPEIQNIWNWLRPTFEASFYKIAKFLLHKMGDGGYSLASEASILKTLTYQFTSQMGEILAQEKFQEHENDILSLQQLLLKREKKALTEKGEERRKELEQKIFPMITNVLEKLIPKKGEENKYYLGLHREDIPFPGPFALDEIIWKKLSKDVLPAFFIKVYTKELLHWSNPQGIEKEVQAKIFTFQETLKNLTGAEHASNFSAILSRYMINKLASFREKREDEKGISLFDKVEGILADLQKNDWVIPNFKEKKISLNKEKASEEWGNYLERMKAPFDFIPAEYSSMYKGVMEALEAVKEKGLQKIKKAKNLGELKDVCESLKTEFSVFFETQKTKIQNQKETIDLLDKLASTEEGFYNSYVKAYRKKEGEKAFYQKNYSYEEQIKDVNKFFEEIDIESQFSEKLKAQASDSKKKMTEKLTGIKIKIEEFFSKVPTLYQKDNIEQKISLILKEMEEGLNDTITSDQYNQKVETIKTSLQELTTRVTSQIKQLEKEGGDLIPHVEAIFGSEKFLEKYPKKEQKEDLIKYFTDLRLKSKFSSTLQAKNTDSKEIVYQKLLDTKKKIDEIFLAIPDEYDEINEVTRTEKTEAKKEIDKILKELEKSIVEGKTMTDKDYNQKLGEIEDQLKTMVQILFSKVKEKKDSAPYLKAILGQKKFTETIKGLSLEQSRREFIGKIFEVLSDGILEDVFQDIHKIQDKTQNKLPVQITTDVVEIFTKSSDAYINAKKEKSEKEWVSQVQKNPSGLQARELVSTLFGILNIHSSDDFKKKVGSQNGDKLWNLLHGDLASKFLETFLDLVTDKDLLETAYVSSLELINTPQEKGRPLPKIVENAKETEELKQKLQAACTHLAASLGKNLSFPNKGLMKSEKIQKATGNALGDALHSVLSEEKFLIQAISDVLKASNDSLAKQLEISLPKTAFEVTEQTQVERGERLKARKEGARKLTKTMFKKLWGTFKEKLHTAVEKHFGSIGLGMLEGIELFLEFVFIKFIWNICLFPFRWVFDKLILHPTADKVEEQIFDVFSHAVNKKMVIEVLVAAGERFRENRKEAKSSNEIRPDSQSFES